MVNPKLMKEKDVERLIYYWLNSFDIKCYQNRVCDFNSNIFMTKGSQKKPDIIIKDKKDYYYVCEIKNGNVSKNIYDGTKILDYLKEYKNKKIIYYINNKQVYISAFLVATQYSIIGKLFEENELEIPKEEWLPILLKYGKEPKKEYKKTKQYIRQLWGQWRRNRDEFDSGLGILLSGVLNNNIEEPYIFYQIRDYNVYQQKMRWNVRWTKL